MQSSLICAQLRKQVAKRSFSKRKFLFETLRLKKFNNEEIKESFSRISLGEASIKVVDLRARVEKLVSSSENETAKIDYIVKKIQANDVCDVGFDCYSRRMISEGERLDRRVFTIGGTFLAAGTSIGIIIPCMPMLVRELDISSSDFGYIVSAFGISRLIGNVPSTYLVDKIGRKPVMLSGLVICAAGFGAVTLAVLPGMVAVPTLISARLLTGLGVSAFTAGAMMMMLDVSTALNRARSMAPVMASFQAGIAMGPALGGFAIENVGISATYLTCAFLFTSIATINHFLLPETKEQLSDRGYKNDSTNPSPVEAVHHHESLLAGVAGSFNKALKSWRKLTKERVQMTILPVYMVGAPFSLGASQIGGVFAFMSLTSVVSSQPAAYLADKRGKEVTLIGGCSLVAASMGLLPFATSFEHLFAVLMPMAIGTTIVQSVPTACVADLTSGEDRSQGLSLLRTCGDVGYIIGALSAGALADSLSLQVAMHANAGLISGAAACFAARHAVGSWKSS